MQADDPQTNHSAIEVTGIAEFLIALEPAARPSFESDPQLPDTLHSLWSEGARVWPLVSLPTGAFLAHLARKANVLALTPSTLTQLHVTDLYLACAAALGDAAANKGIESSCFPSVDAAVARLQGGQSLAADVKQTLRWQFFITQDGKAPELLGYHGHGPLRAWITSAAIHIAQRMMRHQTREGVFDESFLHVAAPNDFESEYIRLLDGDAFKRIVTQATAALPAKERLLLCQHYIEDFSIDRLATMYSVHRATVARWIDRSRQTLRSNVMAMLNDQLKLSPDAAQSLVRFMMSDLNLTMSVLGRPNR